MEYVQVTNDNKSVILELFSKQTDNEGYITEKKTGKRLICPYSKKEIKVESFSVLPGSAIFVNNEPYCFAEHLAKLR